MGWDFLAGGKSPGELNADVMRQRLKEKLWGARFVYVPMAAH